MINTAIRGLGFIAFLFALWAAGGWLLDPVAPALPASVDKAWVFEHFMPLVAVAVALFVKGMLPGFVLLTAGAITMVAVLAAGLLAAWLAWRNVDRAALRRLVVALSLGVVATCWFGRVRIWPGPLDEDILRLLDYPFMLAGFLGAWTLLACFTIYPEPISHALARSGVGRRSSFWQRLGARQRAGDGFWRLWSWLPAERYGAHGRATSPGLRGLARFLGSRESFWCLAFLVLLVLVWQLSPSLLRSADALVRAALTAVLAFFALYVVDPLFGARIETAALSGPHDSWWRGADASAGLHRAMVGRAGYAAAAVLAVVATAGWHRGGLSELPAVLILVFSSVVILGLVMNAMLLNWLGGNAEQRRAIGWIFLGTAIPTMTWMCAAALLVFVGLLGLVHDAPSPGRLPWGLAWQGAVVLVGVPTSLLAFVASLWISILHRGSFDPTLALRRGAGVVALGVVLTALFVAVEGAASSLIVTQLGMPSASGPIVAGTAVAIGFQPLRTRVERGVEKAMQRLLPPEAVADGERRELAILFSDLSGYTRLAETDETEALTLAAILHRHAHVVAGERGGRVVKTLGDAVLCVFDDAAAALAAADALHRGYRDEAARRDLDGLPIHSGLHVGEVVIARDGDVFGASVNLAARLLSLAGAEELVASRSAAAAIAAAGLAVEVLPGRCFRNLAEPVDCLRVRWGAT